MTNSTQFSLAVHTLMMVAYFPDLHVTSHIVAASAGCHPVIIRNLFIKLRDAGLLITKPGRGKTELGRPVKEITLWDIFMAVESEQAFEPFKIHTASPSLCPVGAGIRTVLQARRRRTVDVLRRELSACTLASLLDELQTLSLPAKTPSDKP